MPLQNNRRRSLRSAVTSYETKTPLPKQSHLTPLTRVIKRTYSKSSSAESVSSRWQDTTLTQAGYILPQEQEESHMKCGDISSKPAAKKVPRRSLQTQTLTQAGFVFYPSLDDENLAYDGEPVGVPDVTPKGRKRSRNDLEEPITSRTRSAKKRAGLSVMKSEDNGERKNGAELEEGPVARPDVARALMPPPKTPQSKRRREVPSSQSPADTPLSTQSRRSSDILRSPLKDKSVNIRRRMGLPGKIGSRTRMLQVADSLGNEDEDESPTLTYSSTTSIPVKFEPFSHARPLTASNHSRTDGSVDRQPEEPVPSTEVFSLRRNAGAVKSEISDSDNEIDETDDDDFGSGSASQIMSTGPNPVADSSIHVAVSAADSSVSETEETPKRAVRISQAANKTPRRIDSELDHQLTTPRPERRNQPRIDSRNWLPLTSDPQSALRHSRHHSPIEFPTTPHGPSISSTAAIPLPFPRNPSPPTSPHDLPETESQFENAWRDYSPPKLDEVPTLDPPTSEPSLPTYPLDIQHKQQLHQQQKQQKYIPAPVPPSQATTVDITQHPSSPHAPRAPPFPPLSSSSPPNLHPHPIDDKDEDPHDDEQDTLARDIGGWQAVRLTDSQLLPDSLVEDIALAGPPVLLLSSSPCG